MLGTTVVITTITWPPGHVMVVLVIRNFLFARDPTEIRQAKPGREAKRRFTTLTSV
jgi:hypothetical protein